MIREVRVAAAVFEKAQRRFPETRSAQGAPSEYDFVGGPLAAAIFAFRDFDRLAIDLVASVRSYTVLDPFFGAVVFVGVLLEPGVVEVADFDDDPDYWAVVDDDPE